VQDAYYAPLVRPERHEQVVHKQEQVVREENVLHHPQVLGQLREVVQEQEQESNKLRYMGPPPHPHRMLPDGAKRLQAVLPLTGKRLANPDLSIEPQANIASPTASPPYEFRLPRSPRSAAEMDVPGDLLGIDNTTLVCASVTEVDSSASVASSFGSGLNVEENEGRNSQLHTPSQKGLSDNEDVHDNHHVPQKQEPSQRQSKI
jgi:hypothetical protein